MGNPAQIVHESETQRQFIRLQLPAMADIADNRYSIKDLSSGGMAIRDIDKNFSKGKILNTKLILPFPDFSLDIDIKSEIQHIDKKTSIAGVRFIDLNTNQISILNHVIKSFMAGDIVGSQDLLNVVSRENFVNVRQHNSNTDLSIADKIKRYGIYGILAIATLFLSIFIINNILEKLFVITTTQAVVYADTVNILNPASGQFVSTLNENAQVIKKGQLIGKVKASTPEGNSLAHNIISPCDCFILNKQFTDNTYMPQNTKLLELLPQSSSIIIHALVSTNDIHRINIGTPALAKITGVKEKYHGEAINIQNKILAAGTEQSPPTAMVFIKTDKPVPHDLINRPAFIEFHL